MITLWNELAIKVDNDCYTLGKPYTYADKAGKELTVLQNPSYYTSMANALDAAINQAMRKKVADGVITDLREYVKEPRRLKDEVQDMLHESLS